MGGITLLPPVIETALKKIQHPKGDIYHALKNNETSYVGFGEAYFTTIITGEIKGWKKHNKMILNLVVPVGQIKFVLYDDREFSTTFKEFWEVEIGEANYQRLSVPTGIFMSFQGIGLHRNMLLNIASIPHDPAESVNKELSDISYSW
jgi:dTDP-4-dehydrorhamnose 3,5-epimerase